MKSVSRRSPLYVSPSSSSLGFQNVNINVKELFQQSYFDSEDGGNMNTRNTVWGSIPEYA
jgi:hypothetical protein